MHVQGIEFHEGAVQISYVEDRDVELDKGIIEVRTLVIPVDVVEEEASELVDAAHQLVDKALLVRRAPADSFTRSR